MDDKGECIYASWLEMADKDFETMQHLYQSGDMHWALFVGHPGYREIIESMYCKTNK